MLLDNNMPVGFARLLAGHEVIHARDLGWQQARNGDLVKAASKQFDVLITLDKNMEYQTSLKGLKLCVLVLFGQSDRIEHLAQLLPRLSVVFAALELGAFVKVTASG